MLSVTLTTSRRRVPSPPSSGITITTPDGNKIRIVLVVLKGTNQATIAIDAPREYAIVRDKIKDKPKNLSGRT